MKSLFNITALKMPSLEQIKAGELPYVLLRWPRKVELPSAVQDAMKEKGIVSIPTVSMNVPFSGSAVSKFLEIQNAMLEAGDRFAIEIEFDLDEVKLTGANKFYLNVNPVAINLGKVEKLEPTYQGGQTTEATTALAKVYNDAIRAAATARIAVRATPSGTVIPEDVVSTDSKSAESKEIF